MNAWRIYLERRLGRPVVFVQRARYREIVDLLRAGKLDFAWVCGFPYVNNRDVLITLLAVPVYQNSPGCRDAESICDFNSKAEPAASRRRFSVTWA